MGPAGAWRRRRNDRERFRPFLGRLEQLWGRGQHHQFRGRIVLFFVRRQRGVFGALNAVGLLIS
jgi:hypothetical protein